MLGRRSSAALRWGGVGLAAFAAAIGVAPLAPELSLLGATSDWVGDQFAALGEAIGAGGSVEARMAVSAAMLLLLAAPLSGRLRLGGPRLFAVALAVICGGALAFALSLGVGGELIRLRAGDPGAPALSEATVFGKIGYKAGYLHAADYAIGSTLQYASEQAPSFAAQDARLDEDVHVPLPVWLYGSLVCLAAFLPIYLARTVLAAAFDRVLRTGAARLVAAVFLAAVMIAAFVGAEALFIQTPPPQPA